MKRQDVHCTLKQRNNKQEFIPVTPQPLPDGTFYIRRNYQILKASSPSQEQFRKRITWIEKSTSVLDNVPDNIAVVEYVSKFPGRDNHGLVVDTMGNEKYKVCQM